MSVKRLSPDELLHLAVEGSRRAVGRLLTIVEAGGEAAESVAELTMNRLRDPHILGVTGAPGAGKSTLVARLVAGLVGRGKTAAVLAVDPSSPLTGGAILGDRVRMADIDQSAFIRSVATRGHAGGLALSVPGAVRVLDASGYDPVVIETVGVGQVEVEVTATADTTIVVVTPGMGDAVQANKAGLLEVGDIFVVNKADLHGAHDARRDLELMLDLNHVSDRDQGRRPAIVMTNSLDGYGVDELIDAVNDHRQFLVESGQRFERRRRRAEHEVLSRVEYRLEQVVRETLTKTDLQQMLVDVAAGRTSTLLVAERLMQAVVEVAKAEVPASRAVEGPC